MALRAGFAEVDITPPLGTEKIGWLQRIVADTVLDPLFARVMVLESGETRVGFVSLDLLSVTASQTARIRGIAESLGLPSANVMVAATHNHAGPATCALGPSTRDDAYVEGLMARLDGAFATAIKGLRPARLGVGTGLEGRVSFIRRYVMKDGSVATHPGLLNPDIRCAEGVPDPELAVLGVWDLESTVRGLLINFACHPTHHGGDTCISAGWPGQLCLRLEEAFDDTCTPMFLNGAFGNVHHNNPLDPDHDESMERIGKLLAEDVQKLVADVAPVDDVTLASESATIRLPFRHPDGPFGDNWALAQPFQALEVYKNDRSLLRQEIGEEGTLAAEVQCIRVGDLAAFVSLPGEVFSQIGLRIKMESPLPNTFVGGAANGMVGYVPHREAFERGGYETTLASWSKAAPESGDLLADAALGLLRGDVP